MLGEIVTTWEGGGGERVVPSGNIQFTVRVGRWSIQRGGQRYRGSCRWLPVSSRGTGKGLQALGVVKRVKKMNERLYGHEIWRNEKWPGFLTVSDVNRDKRCDEISLNIPKAISTGSGLGGRQCGYGSTQGFGSPDSWLSSLNTERIGLSLNPSWGGDCFNFKHSGLILSPAQGVIKNKGGSWKALLLYSTLWITLHNSPQRLHPLDCDIFLLITLCLMSSPPSFLAPFLPTYPSVLLLVWIDESCNVCQSEGRTSTGPISLMILSTRRHLVILD